MGGAPLRQSIAWLVILGIVVAMQGGSAIAHTSWGSATEHSRLERLPSGPSGNVLCSLVVGDTLYAGGFFGAVGWLRGTCLTVDSLRGMPEPEPPLVSGVVNCIVADGHGGQFVGGSLLGVGGLRRFGLARILADGRPSVWSPVVEGEVLSVTVAGGVLYVGGDFSAIDGQARRNLAAFEIGSARLLSWHPDPNDAVLAMHANGTRLYLGWRFSECAHVPRSRLAAWELAADSLTDWAPQADGSVFCIETADSSVYLGGSFYTVEGQPRALLAAVSPIDGHAMAWAPEMARSSPFYHDGGPSVRAIVVRVGAVYVGGAFDRVNQTPCVCLAKLDLRSGALLPWDARWGWFFGGEMPAVTCTRFPGPTFMSLVSSPSWGGGTSG